MRVSRFERSQLLSSPPAKRTSSRLPLPRRKPRRRNPSKCYAALIQFLFCLFLSALLCHNMMPAALTSLLLLVLDFFGTTYPNSQSSFMPWRKTLFLVRRIADTRDHIVWRDHFMCLVYFRV
ncbi:hypothetical protein M441DRAFT_321405 [Trichoderma asperellum CBS 433.97]|uniref:Uncharacterized protein n=1 Tax=Trichoderma asperellum (strain ATCC 204424 / CBS 433.97 / NBRC 101777) TaxID=1042311 RepID=A0A2T3ZLD4_TRIA4|nr:hypothetical protein M441DRAFT_321405 [Trichoderma asperellum CBS 433.97]PTB45606.1 hypothetical protein M441DRAFT_321405 [Trichoderma asperellum CBS 433.97]